MLLRTCLVLLCVLAANVASAQTLPPPTLPLTGSEQVSCLQGGAYKACTTSEIGGAGGVTSVGLSLPPIFTVTVSPVTGAGTLTAILANENANLVFAGPSSGSAAPPTFRSLVVADFPFTYSGNTTKLVTQGSGQVGCIQYDGSGNATGTGFNCGNAGATTPGGSSDQVQYNSSGVFGGSSSLIFTAGALSSLALPDGGSLTASLDTFDATVTSAVTPGNAAAFSIASGSRFGCLWSPSSNNWSLGSTSAAGSACGVTALTWGYSGGTPLVTLFGTPVLDGNTTINDVTAATQIAFFHLAGSVPIWTISNAGYIQIGNGSEGLSELSATIIAVGSGAGLTDASMSMKSLTLGAAGTLTLPDTGTLVAGSNNFIAPLFLGRLGATNVAVPAVAQGFVYLDSVWGGLTFGAKALSGGGGGGVSNSVSYGGAYFEWNPFVTEWVVGNSYAQGSHLCEGLGGSANIPVGGIVGNFIQIGNERHLSNQFTNFSCGSQIISTDVFADGKVLTGTPTGGSGYTNGTFPIVLFTGGKGASFVATVTVSGNAFSTVNFTPPNGDGGLNFLAGDVLTTTDSRLGAGTGGNFTVATVTGDPYLGLTSSTASQTTPAFLLTNASQGVFSNGRFPGWGQRSAAQFDYFMRVGLSDNYNAIWASGTPTGGVQSGLVMDALEIENGSRVCQETLSDNAGTLQVTLCQPVATLGTIFNGGTGGTPGTYPNVAATSNYGTGLTLTVTVNGSGVGSAVVVGNNPGRGYFPHEMLTVDPSLVGGLAGFEVPVATLATTLAPFSASLYSAAGTVGVTCATGSPTSSFAAVGGIVTHC